jgi:tetratricopeptide (TPR) repeat protein
VAKKHLRKIIPYPRAIALAFALLCASAAAVYAAAEQSRQDKTQPAQATTASVAAEALQSGIDLGSAMQILQGQLDSYKNDLSNQVSNYHDSLGLLLAVAAGVFGLFGVAVPLINYAYSKEDKKEVQESLALLEEANNRTLEIKRRLEEAEDIVTALNTTMDQQQLHFTQTMESQQKQFQAQMQQYRELAICIAEREKWHAAKEKGSTWVPDSDIHSISEEPKDVAETYYLKYLLEPFGSGDALEFISQAIALMPHNARYYYERADTLSVIMRKCEEALPDYGKAIEFDPDNPLYYSQRAITLHAMKRYDEALPDCNKAIELDPQNAWY